MAPRSESVAEALDGDRSIHVRLEALDGSDVPGAYWIRDDYGPLSGAAPIAIRILVLDFDGVVVESAELRTDAFGRLFSDYPHHVAEFLDHHARNVGSSRHSKIRHFYENILKRPIPPGVERRAERFRDQVRGRPGGTPRRGRPVLPRPRGRAVSPVRRVGTPEAELHEIVRARGLEGRFEGVYGSPCEKEAIVRSILEAEGAHPAEAVLVGDGDSDRRAARAVGIEFVARVTDPVGPLAGERYSIADLTELEGILERIRADRS